MKIIKISVTIIFSAFFFSFKYSLACQCPTLFLISKDLCEKYEVIFYGKVDSVSPCGTNGISTAHFTIKELYKGIVEQHVQIDFDCSSSCMMSFSKGDEWIIYSIFQRFDLLTVNICGHSRKFFPGAAQDVYQIASDRSFEQEKQYLTKILGIQSFIKKNELNEQQNDLAHQNKQPSGIHKLLLLLASVLAMGIVYYVTRKKKE
ncbi:MAG: hypothetical protein ACT4ON_11855 [Bacteroidota bacterium]